MYCRLPTDLPHGRQVRLLLKSLCESYPVSGQSATGTGPTLITSNGHLPIPIGRLTCPAFIALLFLCAHVWHSR